MYEYRYSTRSLGDMRKIQSRKDFLKHLGLENKQLVIPEQVHGSRVVIVTKKDGGTKVVGADGLVTKDPSIVLGVLAADCVPLLFVDPEKRILGAAHAGWRGTLAGIAQHTVDAMKSLGSLPSDIVVSIGPHIHSCSYSVPEERAMHFRKAFGNDRVTSLQDKTWFIDLGLANYLTLTRSGIVPTHIENISDCTFCGPEYFSYRKDNKKTFGEMMGVMAWK